MFDPFNDFIQVIIDAGFTVEVNPKDISMLTIMRDSIFYFHL